MLLWRWLISSFLQPIELDRNIHRRNVVLVNVRLGLVIDRVNESLLRQDKTVLGARDLDA